MPSTAIRDHYLLPDSPASDPRLTPETEDRLDAFFGLFASQAAPLLLLDYDGTLAPFRTNRFEARPWAGIRELVSRIQRQGRTRMAIITGRPAHEIAPLLALDSPLEVWGLHGAERLSPDGARELEAAPPAALEKLDEMRALLSRDSLGGLFEDKPNAVVMHWRGASPNKAAAIEKRTRQLFEPLVQLYGLALLKFEAGVELRVGRDKGGAVGAILAESSQTPDKLGPVAFLGDDLTDEAGFRAVNAHGAESLSILVRRELRPTSATMWLRPPGQVRAFLNRWAEAVER